MGEDCFDLPVGEAESTAGLYRGAVPGEALREACEGETVGRAEARRFRQRGLMT